MEHANDTIDGVCERVGERPISEAEAKLPREPGEPGSLWKDDAGRIVRVPSEPAKRRWVGLETAADGLLEFIRAYGPGWHLSEDVSEFWGWYAAEEKLVEHPIDAIKGALARRQGVVTVRKRVGALQGADWSRLRSRCKTEKVSLYYIASVEELEAEAKSALKRPVTRKPAKARASGSATGKGRARPGMDDLFIEAAA